MAKTPLIPDQTFIEQAEYLSPDDFLRWSAQHPREKELLKKLTLGGAKLITGPRGCGKSTLLLKAYHSMGPNTPSKSFPVYVNYKISLKLEPIYADKASATYWFKQWLLGKIYLGLYDGLQKHSLIVGLSLSRGATEIGKLVSDLELGKLPESNENSIDIRTLSSDLERVVAESGCERCVLLLDDAAHAFSAQQQRDFFELFRQLKSRIISPKAAIYPGVTHIPGFQVGHDAEEIDVWIDPYSDEYLPFMEQLVQKRVPSSVFSIIKKRADYFKLSCYASFGVPRALLNMVREFYTYDPEEKNVKSSVSFLYKDVMEAVRTSFHNTLSVFDSLRIKLPIYENFVECGRSMLDVIYSAIKDFNRGKDEIMQSVTVAIKEDIDHDVLRVFGFYQYAGLLRFHTKVSRGEKGTFLLFRVHIGGLVESNALFGERTINIENYVTALGSRNAHAFTRVGVISLLRGRAPEDCLELAMPPCGKCGAPRQSPEARFCGSCGQPFKDASIFRSLAEQPISLLPLTPRRVSKIEDNSAIRTVKDILIDHDGKELRKVPQIGPIWAQRIQSYAEEFIS